MSLQARSGQLILAIAGLVTLMFPGCGGESGGIDGTTDASGVFFPGMTCSEDSECAPTGICLNGICSRQCTTDDDCSSEELMCLDWACVLRDSPSPTDTASSPKDDTSTVSTDVIESPDLHTEENEDVSEPQNDSTTPPEQDAGKDSAATADATPDSIPTELDVATDPDISEADASAPNPDNCGNGSIDLGEECDGDDVAGKTCQDFFFPEAEPLDCNPDCTLSTLPCPGTHMMAYANILNIIVTDDLHSVRWHPSGDFALILGSDGQIVTYKTEDSSLSVLAEVDGDLNDLDVAPDGTFFLIVGTKASGDGQVWRVAVTQGGDLTPAVELVVTEELPLTLGTPVAVEAAPQNPEWVFGSKTSTSTSANYLYLWRDGEGLTQTKSFVSGGLTDLMWAYPESYGGKATVITSNGSFGSDSHSFILDTGTVVDNGYGASFGNPGGAGWRPNGSYGILTAVTTNKAYIFDGAWSKTTLPGVGTAASPNAIGWKPDGTRALIVGRPIGTPLRATVIEHRPGAAQAHAASDYVDMSIPEYAEGPWNGVSNAHLLGIDWRPNSLCDEGLIVGADSGTSFAPTFGKVIRFYDQDDPDCAP